MQHSSSSVDAGDDLRVDRDLDEPAEGDGEDGDEDTDGGSAANQVLEPFPSRAKDFWKFHMRPPDDDEPEYVNSRCRRGI